MRQFSARRGCAIAKYSFLADGKQIFASKYRLVLPTEEELEQGLKAIEAEIEHERLDNQNL